MHVVFNEYELFDIRTSLVYDLGQVYFLSLLEGARASTGLWVEVSSE